MIPFIEIGGAAISTYRLALIAGIVAMLLVLWTRRELFCLKLWQVCILIICLTVIGVCGGQLLYVIENLNNILAGTASYGGLSLFGAVFLIPTVMPLIGRLFSLDMRQTCDACAPCVAVMFALIRVGCFCSGCCGGREFCLDSRRFFWPTQLMDSIANCIILALLLKLEGKAKCTGNLYPVLMMSYSVARFFIEFLRDTEKDWLHLSHGQWFSVVAFAIGLVCYASIARRNGNVYGEAEAIE